MSEKSDLKKGYQVFHSPCEQNGPRLSIVLVRPENGANIGSIARAMANFGVKSKLKIVGRDASIIDAQSYRLAVHAETILKEAEFFPDLPTLFGSKKAAIRLAATARIASAHRAHPARVDEAIGQVVQRFHAEALEDVYLVFGCESDGLSNDEVAACDAVVTVPSAAEYRSLNLAQAVVVFLYEWNRAWILDAQATKEKPEGTSRGQKQKLISHFLKLAEEVGFILPDDPFKMRPRLQAILDCFPPHLPEVRTLHGLLDQISRSLKKGEPDIKGRFRSHWKKGDPGLISID